MADLTAPAANISPAQPVKDFTPAIAALAAGSTGAPIPFGLDPTQVGALLSAQNNQNENVMKAVQLLMDNQYKTGMLKEQQRQTDLSVSQFDLAKFKTEAEVNMQQAKLELEKRLNEAQLKESGARTAAGYAQAEHARAAAGSERQRTQMLGVQTSIEQQKLNGLKELQNSNVTLPDGSQVSKATLVSTELFKAVPGLIEVENYKLNRPQVEAYINWKNDALARGQIDFGNGIKLSPDATSYALQHDSFLAHYAQLMIANNGKATSPEQYLLSLQANMAKSETPTPELLQSLYEVGLAGIVAAKARYADKESAAAWDEVENTFKGMLLSKFPKLKLKDPDFASSNKSEKGKKDSKEDLFDEILGKAK